MKTAIIAITTGGKDLAARLVARLPDATLLSQKGVTQNLTHWQKFDAFICIMATGIVVRAIAPLLVNKQRDPCVVVVDEKGQHAISLLSGHLGGGNDLARQVAQITDGVPVITTASDTLGLVALDIWAREQHLAADKKKMTRASALLVNNGSLSIYTDVKVKSLPAGLTQTKDPEQADLIISNKKCYSDLLVFQPQNLVLGTGCNRNTPMQEFIDSLNELFKNLGLCRSAIRNLSSIDKKSDEKGLLAFAKHNNWQIDFFSKEEINRITDVEISPAALKAVGAIGVAEPCALLSADKNRHIKTSKLISRKRKWQNITMAVAEVPFTLSAQVQAR